MQINLYEEENRLIIVVDNPTASVADVGKGMLGTATAIEGLKPIEKEEAVKPEIPENLPAKESETESAVENTEAAKAPSQSKGDLPDNDKGKSEASDKKQNIPPEVVTAYELAKNSTEMKKLGIDKTISLLFPGCRKVATAKLKELTGNGNVNDFIKDANDDMKVDFMRFIHKECITNGKKFGF